jgi:protein-S-isoprenylcysteine O-methyltransferase Ste14
VIALKIFMFIGLVIHKVIWELLRIRDNVDEKVPSSSWLSLIKAVKVAVLLAILVQIWLPDVFPISSETFTIRVVGLAVYTIGLVTAVTARFQLGENWSNIETGQILAGQHIVSRGVYRFIRHPIYTGDLMLLLGLELALNSLLVLGVFILVPIVMMKAIGEEKMLERDLAGYSNYCRDTKRFIPFVI